ASRRSSWSATASSGSSRATSAARSTSASPRRWFGRTALATGAFESPDVVGGDRHCLARDLARSGRTEARPGRTEALSGRTGARPGRTGVRPGKTEARPGKTEARSGKSLFHVSAPSLRRIWTGRREDKKNFDLFSSCLPVFLWFFLPHRWVRLVR